MQQDPKEDEAVIDEPDDKPVEKPVEEPDRTPPESE